eukprot:NODE_1398_length_1150_cov_0.872502.p1 type:complete len:281 gc:universal NODE_1398_length_1150_cov_0.872502:1066-224(-)
MLLIIGGLLIIIFILFIYKMTPKIPHVTSMNLYGKSSCTLSVIIPCYNESDRLHLCFDDIIETLPTLDISVNEIEFIFVNDGSNDDTLEKLKIAQKKYKNWNIVVLDLPNNRGKGYGVRHGMFHSKGEYAMFMDADAAASFRCIKILWNQDSDVVVGSRKHIAKTSLVKRSQLRNFLMYSFHLIVYIFGVRSINDTQCGFKLFKRKAAQMIFKNARIDRFLFDVELIFLAEHFGLKIKELGIPWNEVPGSKMSIIRDSMKMIIDLLIMRFGIILGIRKIK